jgi:hypothetical protein
MRHDRLAVDMVPELLEGHCYIAGQPGTLWRLEWPKSGKFN